MNKKYNIKSNLIYFAKKMLIFIVGVWFLSFAVFFISKAVPGDPLISYYGERVEKMTVEEKQQAIERLGLNEPVWVQYGKWLGNAMRGDFGMSLKYKQDCMEVIRGRSLNTIILAGFGIVFIFVGSLLVGIICALNEGKLADRIISRAGTFISCIPEFWLSIVMILVFAVLLKVLPSGGAYDVGMAGSIPNRIWHLILPLFLLVLTHLWYYGYMVRNKLTEEMRKDYALMAKAKGRSRLGVVLLHCLRNTMPSYISIMALSVAHVLGDAYIIEAVFGYPGIGALAYESARFLDYNLLMLICMITGIIVIFCNMLGQIANERIDPRMKAERRVTESDYRE